MSDEPMICGGCGATSDEDKTVGDDECSGCGCELCRDCATQYDPPVCDGVQTGDDCRPGDEEE